ncbi:hypothetical protein LAZ67_11002412 [Cordylochernes scorpioides]|uniref:Uncharacterized protein n=1 Tax=Cordylochernes scorpioides TaxID=51811 RepID=A0ABY6KZ86_9ARAC|nr:hypothetical protein LAZ67_11002412 [Cordylochernes scorpioides]
MLMPRSHWDQKILFGRSGAAYSTLTSANSAKSYSKSYQDFNIISVVDIKLNKSLQILECYYGKDSVRTFTTASTCHPNWKMLLHWTKNYFGKAFNFPTASVCLAQSLSPCLGDKHPSLCHGLYLCPVGCPRSLSVLTSSPASASCCPRVGRTSTLASRTRLPAYAYVGRITFATILQEVDRITEDSGMQRMTAAPLVNGAIVWMLLLLALHLDDPVDYLKDAMRGLAVPRI